MTADRRLLPSAVPRARDRRASGEQARLVVARQRLLDSGLDLEWVTPEPAPVEAIARVHDPAYIESVRELAEAGGGWLDLDTAVSPRSYEAALLAAGAGLMAVDRALETGQKAFMLVRPPGHHACRSRGMGFCLFNNIAVAAAYALEAEGAGAGAHRRLGRAPRQRHPGHVLRAIPGCSSSARTKPATIRARARRGRSGREIAAGYHGQRALAGRRRRRRGAAGVRIPCWRRWRGRSNRNSCWCRPGYDPQTGDPLGDLRFSQTSFQWMAARLVQLAEEMGAAGPLCFLEGGYRP